VKIAVLSADKTHIEQIRQILVGDDVPVHSLLPVDGGPERLSAVSDQQWPDAMIVDSPHPGAAELALFEQVLVTHPNQALILICDSMATEFTISAMRVGIRDILQWPLEKETLLAAIRRVDHKVVVAGTLRAKARTLAFIPCKGGSGATFLAANLAYALAVEENKKVALFDLNLQFGDAVLFLSDHVPATTLADVARSIDRLDASLLEASMVHVTPNLSMLPAPENPEHSLEIMPEHIEVVLNLAAAQYDYIVLDVGRVLVASSIKALDHADAIFPVLQQTLPFIRDAKRLIHALESLGYSRQKIHLLVNRFETGGDIRLEDVERTLEVKVHATIPNSFEAVSASVNQGVSILKIASHDSVSKSLRHMAHELVHGPTETSGGWWANLLRHD
jgi:pilus assembly protein CpaE